MPLLRLKPRISWSQAKHFTTAPQCSPLMKCVSGTNGIAKSVNPDQTAPSGAVWSGYTLFACTYIYFNILGQSSTYQVIDDNKPIIKSCFGYTKILKINCMSLLHTHSSCTSVCWCLVVTCWERADLLALICDVYLWSCHFPIGILGQVWCLIVSIPDLCPLFSLIFICLHQVSIFVCVDALHPSQQ